MNKNPLNFLFAFLLILPVSFYSCQPRKKFAYNEGYIEYEISYPAEATQDKLLTAMMPTKMTMWFKNDSTKSDISIGMGLMSVTFISLPEEKTLSTLLQILEKKYALVLDSNEVSAELKKKAQFKIEFTKEKKEIAGYKCKKAIADDGKGKVIHVFYTEELKISNPHWSTPLHEIPGTLLEYELVLNNVRMKLKAKIVEASNVNSGIFKVPDDFDRVKAEEMPEIFSQFFQ